MDLATFHAIVALRPHPNRARYLRGDVTYCPLCGFFLPNEWDSHFTPCLVRRGLEAWYSNRDADVSWKAAGTPDAGP